MGSLVNTLSKPATPPVGRLTWQDPGTEVNTLSVLRDSPKWGLSLSCISTESEDPVVALQFKGIKWPKNGIAWNRVAPLTSDKKIISEWVLFDYIFSQTFNIF